MPRPWPLALPVVAFAVLFPLAACALDESAETGDAGDDSDDPGEDPGDDPDQPDPPAAFRTCTALPYTPGTPAGFEHLGNEVVAAGGAPTHHAQDIVARADQPAALEAVFQYSVLAVDVTDELVKVSLDACDGWRDLGPVRTDGDGRVTVDTGEALAPGVYQVVYELAADASLVSAYLWSLPEGTHLAVFDIDGTLTTSDTELWQEILLGDYVPEAYPSAAALTQAHADRGHLPVYLAGRPSTLDAPTRAWLDELEFAHGVVHLSDSGTGPLPTDGGVGAFKRDFIVSLLDAGMAIDLAYGNASTDIFAYLSAGLPAAQVWIIGTHAGEEGTQAVQESWTARAAEVASSPPVEQPFTR